MGEMTGGEAVYEALRGLGVDRVFGIVSVHNNPIYDAIARRGDIAAISVRHEQAAVHMADGYARATGKLGVAIASTGPGTSNAMTGLFEAGFASSRVLLITGQVETGELGKGRGVLHEAEQQLPMLRSVTRMARSPRTLADVPVAVLEVARDILTGRPQPGAVEIPIDLQFARGSFAPIEALPVPQLQPDADAIAQAAELLAASTRRLLWAGGGVITAGAHGELLALAERLQAPVVTSINGRGALPDGHPLCMGNFTHTRPLQQAMAQAEVVLAVGTRFQAGAVADHRLRMPGKLVHLDADAGVIGRCYRAAVPIHADARLGLSALHAALAEHGVEAADGGFADGLRAAHGRVRDATLERIGPDHRAIMETIRARLPDDGIVARDATMPAYYWGNRLLPLLRPRTSMQPTSAAIGPGLPLGVGAAVGSGKRTVVIHGDGGFMLHIGELATVAQYRPPLIICVFDDGGYDVLRRIQAQRFEGRNQGVELSTPDFVAVSEAMGVPAVRVGSASAFDAAFARAVEREGPMLISIDARALSPLQAAR